ncbi:hypothetical protein FOZ61_007918 [Perkinsus olseni]|uniref:Mannosyltransferase n=1 Tax=Perkinsus olseni TaxID=32597 RepID=A0A7J6M4R2_PEROL|nr:hypothetical protein FOL46_003050 [Perkinsus olseni]KAF4670909.1 hypothetical protein FOZ61_007918 [Perkinsus olseni]
MSSTSTNKLTRHIPEYIWFLLYRIVNALLISTYSSADEYWQSIEVSHYLVFGKGYLTWEWRPEVALRSSLMPLFYVPYYWLLKVTGLDGRWLIAYGPRVFVQAPLAALADLCFSKTVSILLEPALARTALVLWLSNWFILSMLTRTFANSVETALYCIIIFALLRWTRQPRKYHFLFLSTVLSAASVLIRPTSATSLAPLLAFNCVYVLSYTRQWWLLPVCVGIGLGTMACIGCLDSVLLYNGSLRGALTWFNFAEFNFINDFGKLYGDDHSWLWYFIAGIPLLLLNHMVPLLRSLWEGTYRPPMDKRFTLSLVLSWLVSLPLLSLASHKELRFIMPTVPVLCLVVAPAVGPIRGGIQGLFKKAWPHLVVALVALRWHQYGPDVVMSELSRQVAPGDSVRFLTPCHATPFTTHVHGTRISSMDILDCSPPLKELAAGIEPGLNERDAFFADPQAHVENTTRGYDWLVVWGGAVRREDNGLARWLEEDGDYDFVESIGDGMINDGPYGFEFWPTFELYHHHND